MAESAREGRGVETSTGTSPVLTPADIRNAAFGTTRLRTGYDMDEVDAFLDMVEEKLAILVAELQRAQEGEAQYRAQYEQLRARVGSTAATTAVRAESPQQVQSAQALAQALLIRQALIAQLREHIGQVESQIRSLQASVDATTTSAAAAAVDEPGTVSEQPMIEEQAGATERATGPITAIPTPSRQGQPAGPVTAPSAAGDGPDVVRPGAPRARGPVPPEATQEIPTQPRFPGA